MKKVRIYRAILVIPLFGGIAARLLRVVIAFFLRDMGLTVFEITILGSVFMLTRGIFSPVLGKLSDKGVSRFLIVVIGFLGLGIDSLLYLHASYPLMLLLRGFDGLYGAMVWPTIQTFVHFSSEQRIKSRLMSVYYVMGGLGGYIGYLLYNTMLGNI
ncbi:MAG TPA: MFS transporter, partial [Candidatus Aciduliprofundum boonei]|nr:MFS transporter [Candidatus Aciduliprofundum boonei]